MSCRPNGPLTVAVAASRHLNAPGAAQAPRWRRRASPGPLAIAIAWVSSAAQHAEGGDAPQHHAASRRREPFPVSALCQPWGPGGGARRGCQAPAAQGAGLEGANGAPTLPHSTYAAPGRPPPSGMAGRQAALADRGPSGLPSYPQPTRRQPLPPSSTLTLLPHLCRRRRTSWETW